MAQARRRARRPQENPENNDQPVERGADLTVLTAMRAYRDEAMRARQPRLIQNRLNWDMFMGVQDFPNAMQGQSKQVLPKVAMAAEQICAFIERGLTDFGNWFSVDLKRPGPLADAQAQNLLQYYLDEASFGGQDLDDDFAALMADAVKVGLLASLMIVKVHGRQSSRYAFQAERGVNLLTLPDGSSMPQITSTMVRKEVEAWQMAIDLIPPEEYLPDPTGRGLYEMHEVERDLWEVEAMADAGVYDQAVVDRIEEDFAAREEQYYSSREIDRQGREASPPDFRKRVVLTELWGTLLRPNGRVAEQNIVCTMANQKYLIRPPEANPFWHGKRPFVVRPLLRVPFSVNHKALFDHATSLNSAMNDLYNLMFDSGMQAAWGNKVVYPDRLEDPRQIKEGISPGMTLIAKEGLPPGQTVLEVVQTG